jgi:hypothetical protein
MTSTSTEQRFSQAGGSGSGEASDKRPFSGPPESTPGARSFSGLLCASCLASLAPGDGHVACFRCLGADHAAAAMAPSVSCVSCRELPEEGILSRHLYFSPAVDLADAIDLFRASPDYHDGVIDAQIVPPSQNKPRSNTSALMAEHLLANIGICSSPCAP